METRERTPAGEGTGVREYESGRGRRDERRTVVPSHSRSLVPSYRRTLPGALWIGTALVLGVCGWLIDYYLRATAGWSPRAATPLGRWYGGIGAGLMLLLVLYWGRRADYRRRFGRLEVWYRTHLWIGLIALALVGAHSGFRCRGVFLTTLQLFFWGAMATGLFGWLLQTWMKRQLLRHEDRPLVLTQLRQEGERERQSLVERLGEVTESEWLRLRASLAGLRRRHLCRFPSWVAWEAMVTAQAGRALARHLNCLDPSDAGAALASLERLNRIEVLASYHRWLRGWTTFHMVLALGLAQLVLWHIYATTWY